MTDRITFAPICISVLNVGRITTKTGRVALACHAFRALFPSSNGLAAQVKGTQNKSVIIQVISVSLAVHNTSFVGIFVIMFQHELSRGRRPWQQEVA